MHHPLNSERFPVLFKMLDVSDKLFKKVAARTVENKGRKKVWPNVAKHLKLKVRRPW